MSYILRKYQQEAVDAGIKFLNSNEKGGKLIFKRLNQ